jgi:gamma-glutamylcyclotransferase (GGCT)/AIG2-like uncharacterized protein YtfP
VGIAMQYYFAYGSNMNHEQMKDRCPGSRFLKRVYLSNYKFVYDGYSSLRKGAVANIVRSENDTVWGALFEVDSECLKSLDRYEGFPTYYQKETVEVQDDQDKKYNALVYLREPREVGKPSDEYRKVVLEGAKNCELPKEYIDRFIMA